MLVCIWLFGGGLPIVSGSISLEDKFFIGLIMTAAISFIALIILWGNFTFFIICTCLTVLFLIAWTVAKKKRVRNKILTNPTSEEMTATIISKKPYGAINIEKFKYEFEIDGKKVYGISAEEFEAGDEVEIIYTKQFPDKCVILG
jgi:membrane protein implicated in regulation of membrane protease activity